MTFRITLSATIPWPGGGAVMACAFVGFDGLDPLFVVSKGRTPYGALQGVFAQAFVLYAARRARALSLMLAPGRN